MKKIAVLGSTGSIGVNTLDVIARYPDKFKVVALSCDSNCELLAKQANRFKPRALAVNDLSKIKSLKERLRGPAAKIRIFGGPQGLEELAERQDADLVVLAISGNTSLMPLVKAIESKKDIALASKEPLVSAGEIIMRKVHKNKVGIIPVDSEHSAIFQCLVGRDPIELNKIYLTGTGGPLRSIKKSLFDRLPLSRVLAHPKWKMGKKISIDSATLMNKGLEVIEARWLFNVPEDNIKVLMHPEAIVHSLVEFVDGALMAQLAIPDMRLPIQYALNFPHRLRSNGFNVDFGKLDRLTFHKPDLMKFPCLSLAYEALRKGGSFPAVLNAANEEAVHMYLKGELKFNTIPKVIEKVLKLHKGMKKYSLEDIVHIDNWAREEAKRIGRSN
ncbi:1-deoxy-D-xylulose-5-phosphate reductoisomerase [Omnitrophica bacterium]|nr:1-deoxy-D-xylulose-5-phosphate reductoisomerase [Candidatus Omnitrophota bacterium]